MSYRSKYRRPGQHTDETPADYLRRVTQNLNHERESLLDDLSSVEGVLCFFELWSVYDTDFWDGVLECIASGEDSLPARNFVRHHVIPAQRKYWLAEIRTCERTAKLNSKS